MLRKGMRRLVHGCREILHSLHVSRCTCIDERQLSQIGHTLYQEFDDGVVLLDKNGFLLEANPAFCRQSGFSLRELLRMRRTQLRAMLQVDWDIVLSQLMTAGRWQGALWLKHKTQGWLPYQFMLRRTAAQSGNVQLLGVFSVQRGMSVDEEQLDPLTGLLHRLSFDNQLRLLCRGPQPFTLLTLDLDQFRQINNQFDHQTGDRILQQLALRLQRLLGPRGMVARVGGDDFALLIPGMNQSEQAQHFAEEVYAEVLRPFKNGDHEIAITGTLGGALWPLDARSPGALWRRAEQALFIARNRHLPMLAFSAGVRKELSYRQKLQQDLLDAVQNNGIWVAYQPIWDNQRQRVGKLEALARWLHPELGNIPPDQFIPLAEESGLIGLLGEKILEQACADLALLHQAGFDWLELSINRSIIEFLQLDVQAKSWLDVIHQHHIAPAKIIFEVTESLLMDTQSQHLSRLHTLREAGCRIAIDDFGTGYSSFNYLRKFPIDIVKIDRSFVLTVPHDHKDTQLLLGILCIVQNLGYEVVVEGIEHEALQQFLLQHHCEYSQGYLFSKPQNFTSLLEYLMELSPQVRASGE